MNIVQVNLARGFRGGERQTALLIQQLAAYDLNQTLVCRPKSPLIGYLKDTRRLSFHTADNMFAGHWRNQVKGDLIHAHEAKAAHWACIETIGNKTPYIITRRVLNPLKKFIFTKKVYRRAAAVVAISKSVAFNLKEYDGRLKIIKIPSSSAMLKVSSKKMELQSKYENRFVIGNVGALEDKIKGQSYLIQAARFLEKDYPELCFIFLGQGKDEQKLKKLAENSKNIEFIGFTESVGDYLSIMNLFVFPSLYEGLGSILLDVLEYGIPIIASNVGGIPDIIQHEKNGLLVPPADSKEIVKAITYMYKHPDARKDFALEGVRLVKKYGPESMAERYFKLYQTIVCNKESFTSFDDTLI